jgi:murein endopeptidase
VFLGGIHLAGAASLAFALDAVWWVRLTTATLLALHGLHGIRLHALRSTGRALVQAVWEDNGSWLLRDRAGDQQRAALLPGALVHPRLCVLGFRLEQGGRRHLLLAADALAAEDARRLRVRLKLTGQSDVQGVV